MADKPVERKAISSSALRAGVALLAVAPGLLALLASPASATVTVLGSSGSDAMALSQAIVDQPGLLSSAAWTHYPSPTNGCNPEGTSDAAITSVFGPPDGSAFGIMTSGEVTLAPTPNSATNSGCGMGDTFRGANDVSILEVAIDVPSGHNCLLVDFQFLSEEYPEYVGSNFNDAFIAELDSSTWSVSGATISAPNNFAFDQNGNPITINSAGAATMNANNAAGSTYDGATDRLTAQTPLSAGAHRVYFTIFDASDHAFDSAVFLDNLRTGTTSGSTCVAGVTKQDPPQWVAPPTPCGQILSYLVGDTASFALQAKSPVASRTATIANTVSPPGSVASIGSAGNPTSASFSWATSGAAPGDYDTQWTATDNLGQSAPTCSVRIHLDPPPAPKIGVDGVYDRGGSYLQGAPWGGWTATPGATNVEGNYLRATNTGTGPGALTVNFADAAFTRPGGGTIPITSNIKFCYAAGSMSQVPADLLFSCQDPASPNSLSVTVPAGQRLWMNYRILSIPDPCTDGDYVANYTATTS